MGGLGMRLPASKPNTSQITSVDFRLIHAICPFCFNTNTIWKTIVLTPILSLHTVYWVTQCDIQCGSNHIAEIPLWGRGCSLFFF